MTISITLIIATYNRPDALHAVLTGLRQQTDTDFSIIIADDGSRDDTRAMVNSFQGKFTHPLVHIWQEDDGFRAAKIRNKAAAMAKTDYLIFIDADCVPNQYFIARHRQLAQAGYFVAGNRILLSEQFTAAVLQENIPIATWTARNWFKASRKKYCNRWLPAIYFPWQGMRTIRPKTWSTARTCNFAVFKADFMAVNGFDESYHGWGFEDTDLAIRLLKNKTYHKSGRFAVAVIHLWHKQNDRGELHLNKAQLNEIIHNKVVRAKSGVEQYILPPL